MKKILFFTLLLMLFGFGTTKNVLADANITLSPSSGSHAVNESFDVTVSLDTGNSPSSGSDFILTWSPASALEVQTAGDISYGSSPLFTSNTPSRDNANGKIISISTMSVATNTFSGKGTLATVKFKAKTAGTVTLRFECSAGSRSDTNIWSSGSDIVNCDQTTGATYSITAGGSSNPAASPTTTQAPVGAPGSTAAPETKGGLPNTGAFEVTLALGLGGALLLIFGIFFPRFLRG